MQGPAIHGLGLDPAKADGGRVGEGGLGARRCSQGRGEQQKAGQGSQ